MTRCLENVDQEIPRFVDTGKLLVSMKTDPDSEQEGDYGSHQGGE